MLTSCLLHVYTKGNWVEPYIIAGRPISHLQSLLLVNFITKGLKYSRIPFLAEVGSQAKVRGGLGLAQHSAFSHFHPEKGSTDL